MFDSPVAGHYKIQEKAVEYQIGDFSKITSLSIKTLRYYHEWGILLPSRIDIDSNYRYYDESLLKKALLIKELKKLEFSLNEIKNIVESELDEAAFKTMLYAKRKEIQAKINHYEQIEAMIDALTGSSKYVQSNDENPVLIKQIPDIFAASIRFKGRYEEIGDKIKILCRYCGHVMSGNFFVIYHDQEYKEEDADIELCLPVTEEICNGQVSTKLHCGGQALTLLYHGSYEQIGSGYKKLIDFAANENLKLTQYRDLYIKGPTKSDHDPNNYLTEIHIFYNSRR